LWALKNWLISIKGFGANLEYPIKVKIGITFIALSSLVSSILLTIDKDQQIRDFDYIDQAVLQEEHFAGLKELLPENTVAGYITDLQPDENTQKGYGYYLTQFYLTQYVLSPAILTMETDHPFVIGNFFVFRPCRPLVPGMSPTYESA